MSIIIETELTHEEQALITRLKSFRVPEMANILEAQLKDPNANLSTFMERISSMVDFEWQSRANKRFNRLMKDAHLRYPTADLDETIYHPERQLDTQTIERLSTCHWIEEGKNLIVAGSSASGKTYLINALCVTAMRQFKRVRYIKANTLMSEMEHARIKATNLEYLNKLTKLKFWSLMILGLWILTLINAVISLKFLIQEMGGNPLWSFLSFQSSPGLTCFRTTPMPMPASPESLTSITPTGLR